MLTTKSKNLIRKIFRQGPVSNDVWSLIVETHFYARQLKAVDDVLKWEGTGEGRVSTIKILQEKVWKYDSLN